MVALRAAAEATASATTATVAATRRVLAVEGVEETTSTGPWVVLRLGAGGVGVGVEGCWVDLGRVFGGGLLGGCSLAGA
jgi:hypothetical protein